MLPRALFGGGLAIALALLVPGPSFAEFQGTPGKVAYLSASSTSFPLKVWDPVTEVATVVDASTWQPPPDKDTVVTGDFSSPAWSPNGRYIAYSKQIADAGNIPKSFQTVIWIYDIKTGTGAQLTSPPTGLLDMDPDPPDIGHTVADFAPAWSPDGSVVYFIREVNAQVDDALYAQRGQNVWSIPFAGGAASQITNWTDPGEMAATNVLAVPNSTDLIVGRQLATTHDLAVLSSGGAIGASLASAGVGDTVITDWDVSPDGKQVAWSQFNGVSDEVSVRDITGGGEQLLYGSPVKYARYSNTGSGVLHPDVTARGMEGLGERLIPDTDADINAGETERLALTWTSSTETPNAPGLPGRTAFDVQPQTLPVIFAPGFLGSIISCGGDTLWPVDLPSGPDLLAMQLDTDGIANAGCATAGPTANRDLVETVLGSDVYKPMADWLRANFPNDRATLFGWDWRKRPHPQIADLDAKIDAALNVVNGPWKDQRAQRVVLVGHSYGGLLIRTYLAAHPKKVARVLTIGTPYWGAPKAVFPLAFGVESPGFSTLDPLLDNDALKALSHNLAGMYQLYPSNAFGPWLTWNGALQGAGAGVAAFVAQIGGSFSLMTQASQSHDSDYEGFFDNIGRIDVRAVVGTGKPTVRRVAINGTVGSDAKVEVGFADGDGTVPTLSASQGPPGVPPKGDPIHRQYRCGVEHVKLGGDALVLAKYKDFIDFGAVPRRLQVRCPATGSVAEFNPGTLGVPPPSPRARPALLAAGPELGLDAAEQAGLAEVMRLPEQTFVTTADDAPVTLVVQITDGSFFWRALDDESEGPLYMFGPLSGTVRLTPGGPGQLPVVTVDGVPVAGVLVEPPQESAPPGGGPGAPGSDTTPSTSTTPTTATTKRVARIALAGKPKRSRRTVVVRIKVPSAGKLVVQLLPRRGKRKLAEARQTMKGAAVRKVTLRAKTRVPRGARLSIRFTPTSGRVQVLTATLK